MNPQQVADELNDLSYWNVLEDISNSSSIDEQLAMFRYFAHIEACHTVWRLVQKFVNDFHTRKLINPYLTVEQYNVQCQSFVTAFLFQPPMYNCKNYAESSVYNEYFKNWNPETYCMDFYKKLKYALGL